MLTDNVLTYVEDAPKSKSDSEKREQIVTLVERIQGLHHKKSAVRTDHDRTILQREIESSEGDIDGIVFQLYSLGEAEQAEIILDSD